MQKCFYINGKSSADFHIFLNSDTYLNSPKIDYTEYSIPSVNGSFVAYNKRFENVIRKFDCYIQTNIYASLNALKKLLYSNIGYVRIESDYDPDIYQYGFLAEEINVEPFLYGKAQSVQFSLYFSCKPQKYIVGDGRIQEMNMGGTPSSNYSIMLPRDNAFIQKVFDNMPIEMIPNEDAFIVFFGSLNPVSPLTNIEASWSGGNTSFIFVETTANVPYLESHFIQVLGYTNSQLSIASATITDKVVWITPFRTNGTFTFKYTNGNSATGTETTSDFKNLHGTLFNPSAIGFDVTDLYIGYKFKNVGDGTPSVFASNIIYVGAEMEDRKLRDGMIELKFDLMPSSMIETLENDYLTLDSDQGFYYVNTRIDMSAMNVWAVSQGKPELSLNDYATIKGNLNGIGDRVDFAGYKSAGVALAGTVMNGSAKAEWWTL